MQSISKFPAFSPHGYSYSSSMGLENMISGHIRNLREKLEKKDEEE